MVKDQKNSYVLYFKGGTVFNNDTKRYNPNTKIKFQVDGFDSPNLDAFFDKGVLNKVASLYRDSSYSLDIPGVIIPKTGTVQNHSNLEIRLQTPAGGCTSAKLFHSVCEEPVTTSNDCRTQYTAPNEWYVACIDSNRK